MTTSSADDLLAREGIEATTAGGTAATTLEYDAVLLAGFGGPEGPDDVMPFLRNVTRGRGIPEERLIEVSHHYMALDGISPINEQNRRLRADLQAELARMGVDLPVLWGNRNWAPVPGRRHRISVRNRPAPVAGSGHLGLFLVLGLPAVPRGLRSGAAVHRAGRHRDHRQGAPVLRPVRVRAAVHRRHQVAPSQDAAGRRESNWIR